MWLRVAGTVVVSSKGAIRCISLGWACLLATAGCEPSGTDGAKAPQAQAGSGGGLDADIPDMDAAVAPPPRDPRCIAPEGVSTAPQTVAEAVALINALPKPLTVPCFVAALARPLSLHAVNSPFSAQPAQGRRNPRIFVFFPGLILSIVPDGPGAHLVEFAEARSGDRSLKAELEFPIAEQLDEASAYHRVFFSETLTTCGFCHQGETRDESIGSPLAMVSPALRPRPEQRVPLTELFAHVAACDAEATAAAAGAGGGAPTDAGALKDGGVTPEERCAMLHAIFDQQPAPLEHEFPASYKVFF